MIVLADKNDPVIIWALSSAGRAPALQAGGQEFDPPRVHIENMIHINSNVNETIGMNHVLHNL
jgi:hypothetical protein